jgi:hypothetical protein
MTLPERIILCLAGLGVAVVGCSLGAATDAPHIIIPAAAIGVAGILAMMASVTA